ncbi:MAG: hypothetical protein RQ723_12740 [Desulfuromonadales bacterium]|nr:hypothetical protein [Desulfuromonadales bacterium]
MLEWIVAVVGAVLGIVVLEIAAELAFAFLSPLRRLFAPPHGAVVLGVTWIVAVWATLLGWALAQTRATPGILLVIFSIPAALVATLVFRDVGRETRGMPPVRMPLPKMLAIKGRLVAGSIAVMLGVTSILSALALGAGGWPAVLGAGLMAVWLGYATVTGRFPKSLGKIFEIE